MTDNLRELKKGEIKQILLQQVAEYCPDFEFLSYKNSCYTFQRIRKVKHREIYELLHILFSFKDEHFACSVASRLNPKYVNESSYNGGLINPHKDLIVLKKGKSVLDLSEAYYYHDGKFETIMKIVKEILIDFKTHGINLINDQYARLHHNEIVKTGLDYIDALQQDQQLINPDHKITGVVGTSKREQWKNDLKEVLFGIKGQSREDRKNIVRTSSELIDLL